MQKRANIVAETIPQCRACGFGRNQSNTNDEMRQERGWKLSSSSLACCFTSGGTIPREKLVQRFEMFRPVVGVEPHVRFHAEELVKVAQRCSGTQGLDGTVRRPERAD